MFWKCNSILQFSDRDCVERVKKVNLDNLINGSRKPQLKIGLCGTKTELKQFINVENNGSQEIKCQVGSGVKTRRRHHVRFDIKNSDLVIRTKPFDTRNCE